MESALARILIKQYLSSLDNEHNSRSSSDDILDSFKVMGEKLKADSRTALTHPESVSLLCDLNNALADWQILKKKNKSIKRIFSRHDLEAQNELKAIHDKLKEAEKLVPDHPTSKTESSQRDLWDRYTFYKPHPFTCTGDEVPVSDEPKMWMADWLLTSDIDFKAVGIYGPGGSGKTALVKSVLKQGGVGDKFKRIIWACLSQLTCEEKIEDVRIIEYLLYRLGLDTDLLVGNYYGLEDKDWLSCLVGELESLLLKNPGNYILVLDDMWHCSEWFAVDFLGKLKKIGGVAVIVTSRRKTVAEKIGENNVLICLKPRK